MEWWILQVWIDNTADENVFIWYQGIPYLRRDVGWGNLRGESTSFWESNLCFCLSSCRYKRLACQSHVWFHRRDSVRLRISGAGVNNLQRVIADKCLNTVKPKSHSNNWEDEINEKGLKRKSRWMVFIEDTGSWSQLSKTVTQACLASSAQRHTQPGVTGMWVDEAKERIKDLKKTEQEDKSTREAKNNHIVT